MATNRTTSRAKTPVKNVVTNEKVQINNSEVSVNETIAEAVIEPKKEPRKYEATDGILCESITSGELGMIGIKSHINYRWADRNDTTEVEYADLVAAIRSNSGYVMKPRFIIRDEEFLEQFPNMNRVYEALYSLRDLKDVLHLPENQMKNTILELPEGAKQSIKTIAATMVQNGTLDSVKKIKILDEMFNTQLMLLTGLSD